MKELLESKVWQGTKQALLEGLDDRRQKIVETVLENQRKHLMETPVADATSSGNIGNFQKIVMPMIRRIIPGTIATEIVGVQPMTGPTGLIFSMRYVYKNNASVVASEAPGGNIAVDNEAFGASSRMRRFYAGGVTPAASGGIYGGIAGVNVGGPYTPAGAFSLASAPLSGEGGDVVDMESFPGRAMGIQVLRQAVEAKTR